MIGRTNAGGGGGGLNFKVVGGTTQPENPKENTIWVNTDRPITSWAFSTDAPGSPADGMVWIKTGFGSATPFNALKKNEVQVCPFSTQQYLDGAWADKTAMIYADGIWSLFHPSKEYVIQNGVIDMTVHKHSQVNPNNNPNFSATNNVTYNGKPALSLSTGNGYYVTHSFANVTVPTWATVFYVESYRIPTYQTNPSINIAGAGVSIPRTNDYGLLDVTSSIDVSAIAGKTGTLKFNCVGRSGWGDWYIGNAWFE